MCCCSTCICAKGETRHSKQTKRVALKGEACLPDRNLCDICETNFFGANHSGFTVVTCPHYRDFQVLHFNTFISLLSNTFLPALSFLPAWWNASLETKEWPCKLSCTPSDTSSLKLGHSVHKMKHIHTHCAATILNTFLLIGVLVRVLEKVFEWYYFFMLRSKNLKSGKYETFISVQLFCGQKYKSGIFWKRGLRKRSIIPASHCFLEAHLRVSMFSSRSKLVNSKTYLPLHPQIGMLKA